MGDDTVTAARTITMKAKDGQPTVWMLDEHDITATIRDYRIIRGPDGKPQVEITLSASLEVLLAGAAVDVLVRVDD